MSEYNPIPLEGHDHLSDDEMKNKSIEFFRDFHIYHMRRAWNLDPLCPGESFGN